LKIDTSFFYTKYTTIPLSNLPLKRIDTNYLNSVVINPILRNNTTFYQQLSTEGSPHKPILFNLNKGLNFSYQENLFEQLWFNRENIRFYNVYKPYSVLKYSYALNGSRNFSVVHAQNVYKDLHIGLQYDVNYTTGSFDKSQVKNQFFNATARYKSPNKKYEGYLGVIRNRALEDESGGLKSDSSFQVKEYSSFDAYPTNLTMASSKWKSFDVVLTQKYNIFKVSDSNRTILNSIHLQHDLSYTSSHKIYTDYNLADAFYTNIFFDSLQTKDSTTNKRLENSIALKNNFLIPFAIGIKHSWLYFADTLNSENSNNFTPFFNLGLNIDKFIINFFGEGVFSKERYNKDYALGGNVFWKNLYAEIELKSQSPQYFFTHYASNNFLWEKTLNKIKSLRINAGGNIKEYVKFNLGYFNIDNYTYISEELSPKQHSKRINILNASIYHRYNIGLFLFEGIASLQKVLNSSPINLPIFQAKQTFAINFNMFSKKLNTTIGIVLRYNTLYYADKYIPALGSFAFQNEKQIGDYLFCDIFINARLQKVDLFLVLMHPYAGLFNQNYYNSPHYPAENLNLRLGVTWRFFD
jgi:hypothetical protein